jgi:hypothetical protein
MMLLDLEMARKDDLKTDEMERQLSNEKEIAMLHTELFCCKARPVLGMAALFFGTCVSILSVFAVLLYVFFKEYLSGN